MTTDAEHLQWWQGAASTAWATRRTIRRWPFLIWKHTLHVIGLHAGGDLAHHNDNERLNR